MGGLFGSGLKSLLGSGAKEVTPPPVKPTPPVPTADAAGEVGTQARKRRPRGFEETFLTGDLIPETDKKRKLG